VEGPGPPRAGLTSRASARMAMGRLVRSEAGSRHTCVFVNPGNMLFLQHVHIELIIRLLPRPQGRPLSGLSPVAM
jgi:hypothetical protein